MTKKQENLKRLCNENDVIAALAIDQRGAIQRMVQGFDDEKRDKIISEFKKEVSKYLTPYASSILLDPIYGLDSIESIDKECGLIMAYEVTGYDKNIVGRLPRLENKWSVKRLVEKKAEAIKILLYYDKDESDEINEIKKAFIERVGSECEAFDLPFFLEIITYDTKIDDTKSKEFAKLKPQKVNGAIKDFSDERYKIDVLKLEVPVNMEYVQGFSDEHVYTEDEALALFKEQSDLCKVPFIFLSAGVKNELFIETLKFAKKANSSFNGVLCGRATWKDGVEEYVKSKEDGISWIKTKGVENIKKINEVLKETATPIKW